MAAYALFNIDIFDPATYEQYRSQDGPTLDGRSPPDRTSGQLQQSKGATNTFHDVTTSGYHYFMGYRFSVCMLILVTSYPHN